VTTRSRQTFEQIVTLPDLAIPLAEAALLMACEEYPQLTLRPYLNFLDQAASRVRKRLGQRPDPDQTIDGLNRVVFDEYGFSGNSDDYYDPRNSFLNEVIERRRGIPIALSTLYMAVASRLDFRIEGIGIPGHFVVRHRWPEGEIFLDPFNRGERMSREAVRTLARSHLGEDAVNADVDPWLRRATHRQILSRMLNNLRMIYLRGREIDKALSMMDLMVITDPQAVDLYRQRGLLRAQTRQFRGAAADLRHYLGQRIEDDSRRQEAVRALARIRGMLN
jgi:regulator of sirC expression with transglutaminase-like and TPR domain